jgi:hypothetical protein
MKNTSKATGRRPLYVIKRYAGGRLYDMASLPT